MRTMFTSLTGEVTFGGCLWGADRPDHEHESSTVILAITAVVAAIRWVAIAIAAVIAIIVLLWNKCEWFREAVTAVWGQSSQRPLRHGTPSAHF